MLGALSRRSVVVVALGALAGCDLVLGLSRRPDDGVVDAGIDAKPDGLACVAVGPQHDEDGDGVTDICDACPGVPGESRADDGDALPSECDPRPLEDRDWMVEFFAFADMTAERWLMNAGWSPVLDDTADYLAFSDASGQWLTAFDSLPPPARVNAYVYAARFAITRVPAGAGQIVVANVNASGDSVLSCGVQRLAAGTTVLSLWYGNESGEYALAPLPAMTTGARYVAELTYDATRTTATCRVTPDGGTPIATSLAVPASLAGRLGLEGYNIGARVDYATIFEQD